MKTWVLKYLNRTWEFEKAGSKTLDKLDLDFAIIRESLWSDYESGKMPGFNNPLEIDRKTAQKRSGSCFIFKS